MVLLRLMHKLYRLVILAHVADAACLIVVNSRTHVCAKAVHVVPLAKADAYTDLMTLVSHEVDASGFRNDRVKAHFSAEAVHVVPLA